MRTPPLLPVVVAMGYLAIAGLHAYWALGGFWPGTDRETLHRTVVGGAPGRNSPGPIATWIVAALLVGAALTVLGAAGLLPSPVSRAWLRSAALVGAGVLAVRGLAGFFDTRLRPATVGGDFARLNVRLYSPLCLMLALSTALAVRA